MLVTRLDDRRIEASVAGHLFGPGEAMGISDNGPRGSRRDQPDARDRQQHLDSRDVGDAASDLSLDPINLCLQRGDLATCAQEDYAVRRR